MFCTIKITDDIIFQGYIDNCGMYKDENGNKKIVITDYKTSTIYKGEKLEKESGQLYLYAEGIRQKTGLPLENIAIRYMFLKYVNVKYQQANGEWKERQIERNQIGNKLYTTAKMWLNKLGYGNGDYLKDNYLEEMANIAAKNAEKEYQQSVKNLRSNFQYAPDYQIGLF